MDVRTGELLSARLYKDLKKSDPYAAKFYEPVPDELKNEAAAVLNGNERARVNLKDRSSALAAWGNEQRHKLNQKK